MNVQFDRSFYKSIKGINDSVVKRRIAKFVLSCEKSNQLSELPNIKKLQGFKSFYRHRIGDYRIGFELINNDTVLFIIACHRKDIYKLFP